MIICLVGVGMLLTSAAIQPAPQTPKAFDRADPALMVELTLDELVSAAGWIIIGTVAGQESKWNADRTNIRTVVSINVQEWVKGQPFSTGADGKNTADPLSCSNSKSVSLTVPGGKVGDVNQWVEDTPVFRDGEKALVFISSGNGGIYTVAGSVQGKYSIVDNKVRFSPLSRADLPLEEVVSSIKAETNKKQKSGN
jgi:hypothetical protein